MSKRGGPNSGDGFMEGDLDVEVREEKEGPDSVPNGEP